MEKLVKAIQELVGDKYQISTDVKTLKDGTTQKVIRVIVKGSNVGGLYSYKKGYSADDYANLIMETMKDCTVQELTKTFDKPFTENQLELYIFNHENDSYLSDNMYHIDMPDSDLSIGVAAKIDGIEYGYVKLLKKSVFKMTKPFSMNKLLERLNEHVVFTGKIGLMNVEDFFLVCSLDNNPYGFLSVYTDKVRKRVIEKFGSLENAMILPSSIHEAIIVPKDISPDLNHLKRMVFSINRTELKAEDILSDNVYEFDSYTLFPKIAR